LLRGKNAASLRCIGRARRITPRPLEATFRAFFRRPISLRGPSLKEE